MQRAYALMKFLMSPTVCERFILHTILLHRQLEYRGGMGTERHMPSPIGQTELDTSCWLALIHFKPRCHSLRLTGTSPFIEPSGHWMFSSSDGGNGGSESITSAGEHPRRIGSWESIVLINPASNAQLDRLANLNV